jgi:hypothetical protein
MVSMYGTYRADEKCTQGFGGRNLKERDHLQDLGIGGMIVLKWLLLEEIGFDWIHVSKDKDK